MSEVQEQERERHRRMIVEACERYDIVPRDEEWAEDPDDGRSIVKLGHWLVIAEDEDRGLYEGDEGELWASVVGAQQYGNEHVKFYFRSEDFDEGGEQVIPWDDVEPDA